MRGTRTALFLASLLVGACSSPTGPTLAELRDVEPDLAEVKVEDGLDRAMLGYKSFLEETPESSLTPEAMRRLADLKLEKEYGILGDGGPAVLPAPEPGAAEPSSETSETRAAGIADHSESERDFERRVHGETGMGMAKAGAELELPGGAQEAPSGPLEAIELYDRILATYPHYEHNDQVLYQKARAYDELGRPDEAIEVVDLLIAEHPGSRFLDEVQFRRAEYYFTRKNYFEAEASYAAVTRMGPVSDYYELALYKLGWTLYKQMRHEEALHEYIALLDYKVSVGYDFDQSENEDEERRIADTYRVISLCFSNLGGPEVVGEYFAAHGNRSYEDRVYSHHGEFYLEKLRYNDAAAVYRSFVALYPLHQVSPNFNMRVVEIYEAGGFPKLVLEAKKEFAAAYGLQSEYWRHFDIEARPEVRSYLKKNLADLANHYHALYQGEAPEEEKSLHFEEALRWYHAYLESFPRDPESPALNYRLADLLLEHRDFGDAAGEYERTAYEYPEHEKSSAAGYAAIYAHRENQKALAGAEETAAKRAAVVSTLRFVDTFPQHEKAAVVLGAAVEDLYAMQEFERAIAQGRRLIDSYPDAELPIRRSAWEVVAHACFELADYVQAEDAYARVLEATPEDDDRRQAVVDNLAAAIYKQGEQASQAGEYRAAADHFLRIAEAAPSSEIRPAAEYDAGAALIRLEDWSQAAAVLETFRESYPDHELESEATKQIAFVHRESGNLAGAAGEYERVADEAEEAEVRREALLLAGQLHEEAEAPERARAVYQRYLSEFPRPLEVAVETRFKLAELHRDAGDEAAYRDELRRIVEDERGAGGERTDRIRYLAAQSALVLAQDLYRDFDAVALVQPFERSLREKQQRMDAALETFTSLVDYEVGEVTAAATFYMAEVYFRFSQALLESERPADLPPAQVQDYELMLEEEAFPFEERAIEVHQKNLELMNAGIYNVWVGRSMARLGELVPGRYAKFEASSGLIDSPELYAYRPPGASARPPQEPALVRAGEAEAAAEPVAEELPVAEPEAEELPVAEVVKDEPSVVPVEEPIAEAMQEELPAHEGEAPIAEAAEAEPTVQVEEPIADGTEGESPELHLPAAPDPAADAAGAEGSDDAAMQ